MARTSDQPAPPRPVIGLIAGLVAGLAASAAMAAFQAGASKAKAMAVRDDDSGRDDEDGDSATGRAADLAANAVTGDDVPDAYREAAGRTVHYVTGAALGALYGIIAEYRPAAASGFGSAYGLAAALVLDEGVVPAAGLADPPWQTPASSHGFGIVSHLVYGMALEGVRALVAGRR